MRLQDGTMIIESPLAGTFVRLPAEGCCSLWETGSHLVQKRHQRSTSVSQHAFHHRHWLTVFSLEHLGQTQCGVRCFINLGAVSLAEAR